MRRATWGAASERCKSCVSGRCGGVRESSSQPLTPKGTAPLLHGPDPRKACATFHGACPRPPRMAMPVAPYTDVTGAGRPRPAATAGPPPGAREPPPGRRRITRRVPVGPSSRCPTARYRPLRPPADRNGGPEPGPADPRPSGTRRAAGRRYGLRPASGHPADTVRPSPDRPWGRMEAATPAGRTPVERMISAHATVCFQPTSLPSQSLAEMADQPPCQQAEGDRAVRFHPMGTGHERQAHFPARLTSETLRDRMLPARLPCRHKAGW